MVDPAVTDALVKAAEAAAAGAAGKKVIEAVLEPPAKEVGDVLGRAVRLALAPVRGSLWTLEQAFDWAASEVQKRFAKKSVPPDQIRPPAPEVFVPALLAMTYTQAEELRSMFVALLANSMDSATAGDVHPSFVEVIKQLTPDEAKILKVLGGRADFYTIRRSEEGVTGDVLVNFETDLFGRAGCSRADDALIMFGNLERQNLAVYGVHNESSTYTGLFRRGDLPLTLAARVNEFKARGYMQMHLTHHRLTPTAFGRRFVACCIDEPAPPPTASPGT